MLAADRSLAVAALDGAESDNGEVDTRSIEELEDEIAEVCTHIDAATYRLLRAIAEFDRREAWGVAFQSTAHWQSSRVGIELVTARENVLHNMLTSRREQMAAGLHENFYRSISL
jgi:hypothetical protein